MSKKENTAEDLSDILQTNYPEVRGFSSHSIKRFCQEKGIRRRGIVSDEQLDGAVRVAVSEVIINKIERFKLVLDRQTRWLNILIHRTAERNHRAQGKNKLGPYDVI